MLLGYSLKGWSQADRHCLTGELNKAGAHQPVPFVPVLVKETGDVFQTDSAGKFRICFPKSGKYILIIRVLGFDSTEVTVETGRKKWVIHLKEKEQWLDAIDVVGKHRHFSSDVVEAQSISAIEKEASTGKSLGDMLRQIAGVSVLQTGPTLFKPMIMGFTGNRIAIIQNGSKVEGQSWGFDHAPEVDPSQAGELVVVKGAQAIRYGMEALGGVVLLEPGPISQKNLLVKSQSAYFQNGKGLYQNLLAEGSHSSFVPFSYRVQAGWKNQGDLSTPRYILGNSAMEEYNGSILVRTHWKAIKSELNASYLQSKFGIFTGSHISSPAGIRQALSRPDSTYTYSFSRSISRPYQKVNHFSIRWKNAWVWSENQETQWVYTHQDDLREEYDLIRISASGCRDCPQLRFKLTSDQMELTHHISSKSSDIQFGIIGLSQGNITEKNIFIPNFRINQLGGFGILTQTWQRWIVETGWRLELRHQQIFRFKNDLFENPVRTFWNGMGSIGFRYQINDHWHLKSQVQLAQRSPSLNEQYANGVHHGTASYEQGSATLHPEKILNTSFSIHHQSSIGSLLIQAFQTYGKDFIYLKPLKDSIISTIRGPFPFYVYEAADVNMKGIDFRLDVHLNTWLEAWLQGALIRSWNYSIQDYLIFQPADRYEWGLKGSHEWEGKKALIIWQAGPTWVQKQTRVPENQDFAPPPDAYWLWNSRITFEKKSQWANWMISIEGLNMTNNAYRDYMNRFRYFALDTGRSFNFRISLTI